MKRIVSTLVICLSWWLLHGTTAEARGDKGASLRAELCLNGTWEIAPGDEQTTMPATGWTAARVPALPITAGHPKAQWYRLRFEASEEWGAAGGHFYLQLEKVGHYVAVFCNGQKCGEHYGQYTPVEADLTPTFHPGRRNEVALYVHDASGRYVRPGADISDAMVCNAYRPAAEDIAQRNWIGVVGDITLSFRPVAQLADVFVETSVRKKMLRVRLTTAGCPAGNEPWSCVAAVFDGDRAVVQLAPQALASGSGELILSAPWSDAVLWGTPPYGTPKLYTLRSELRCGGKVVDRVFTRFGFREVWIDGRDVLLNGKKLWLAGTYHGKILPLRYLNDRRPMTATLAMMQAAGLNAYHGHWDDLGQTWLDVCDEQGTFVLGAFFCDGRPKIHSRADEGWAPWMLQTCAEWVRARRNHPCILLWRPVDVVPPKLEQFLPKDEFLAKLDEVVRHNDPLRRPLADAGPATDIVAWGQPPGERGSSKMDNFAPLENAAHSTSKPILCKEIYGGSRDVEVMLQFFRTYYEKSFSLKSTGMIVQDLPLLSWREHPPYTIQWLSASGPGNRDKPESFARDCANWCDPSKPAYSHSPYAKEFARLRQQYLHSELRPAGVGVPPELLVSGLRPGSPVWLAPADAMPIDPQGMLAATDGTAWFVVPQAGRWRLSYPGGEKQIDLKPLAEMPAPGYGHVQRVNVAE